MKQSLGAKTLAVPSPVWLIGTFDEYNKSNAMTAAWGGICCSRPPCLQVSLRAATYTHGNIMKRKAFTVSIPNKAQWREADYLGIASGRDTDKIVDIGWTAVTSDLVDAPYFKECPMVIECRLKEVVEIGLHTLFVGEIRDVKVDEASITNGRPDIQKIKPMIFGSGDSAYFSVGRKISDAFKQKTPPK